LPVEPVEDEPVADEPEEVVDDSDFAVSAAVEAARESVR
jgi:hypothetical protein